jgi:hypothetical protein
MIVVMNTKTKTSENCYLVETLVDPWLHSLKMNQIDEP